MLIGGYTPYGMLDAFTKAFLERLWSMRHLKRLNEQKLAVTIISGLFEQTREVALKSIAIEFTVEKMHHVAELSIVGNVPCLTCGHGDECENSGIPHMFTEKIKASTAYCVAVENQPVWEKATQTGKLIGQYINKEIDSIPPLSYSFASAKEELLDSNLNGK